MTKLNKIIKAIWNLRYTRWDNIWGHIKYIWQN